MTTRRPEPAPFLDLTEDQRTANMAHVAAITETVRRYALTLPLSADVDDFRVVLTANAPKAKGERA